MTLDQINLKNLQNLVSSIPSGYGETESEDSIDLFSYIADLFNYSSAHQFHTMFPEVDLPDLAERTDKANEALSQLKHFDLPGY